MTKYIGGYRFCQNKIAYPRKGEDFIEELAYSFHLGSDKNKKRIARSSAKNNKSGTTSLSNNAIQNAQTLSRVDKHNYRKYDNDQEDIVIIKGSSSIVDDVKELYKREFEKARNEYNEKQVRDDRKINDYFTHISNNAKNDLACEVIIELGDKKYWDTKDDDYKRKMTNVYQKQVEDLENVVPSFKITSAIIHYDETSPHVHIVGVPIKEGNKNGMSKQVGKTAIFTKDSLKVIQDKMRALCIESFNNEYGLDDVLKEKLKGRNKDINSKDMDGYQEMKNQLEKNKVKLEQADNKSKELDTFSNEINDIVSNLKQSKLSKNTYLLNEEDKAKLEKYIDEVKITNKEFQEMNLLLVTIDNVKDQLDDDKKIIEIYEENNSALSTRNKALNKKIEEQDKTINKLEEENYSLRQTVRYFKDKFKKLLKFLQEKLFGWGKKEPMYKKVVEDLYDKDILDEDDMRSIEKDNFEL
ncbi:MAG TPA: plasmid recombination protein [Bacilli bacterium]|nr:plasmid recombination protein [Bacilli bacterium]